MSKDDEVFWCPHCDGALATIRDAFDHAGEHIPKKGDTKPTIMDDFEKRPADSVDEDAYLAVESDAEPDESSPGGESAETPKNGDLQAGSRDATPGVDVPKTGVHARVEGTYIPADLKMMDIWVLWAPEHGKIPFAPWTTGHCYPAPWGQNVPDDEHPATDFGQVQMFADLKPRDIHASYPFPPGDDGNTPLIPDRVYPTFYLPHDPPDPPIMLVDFDDVRDPDTGRISREVFDVVKSLDAYTEVSSSGEGLHVFVRGELPDGLGKFICPLDGDGHVEMYDHGRMVGATWDHVAGTPTSVPHRQGAVDEIIDRYETVDTAIRRLKARGDADDVVKELTEASAEDDRGDDPASSVAAELGIDLPATGDPIDKSAQPSADGAQQTTGDVNDDIGLRISRSSGDGTNAYYQLDIRDVADTGAFSRYRRDSRNPGAGDWEGPHPGHGGTKTPDAESTNFGVEPHADTWYCFAHDAGGGPLALLGVLEGVVSCGSAQRVYDDPKSLLRTCLYARDHTPALADERPPKKALEAVADEFEIGGDELVADDYRIAQKIYDQLEPGDV